MKSVLFTLGAALLLQAFLCFQSVSAQIPNENSSGSLEAIGKEGKPLGACPLKQTTVKAEISGFLSRVHVVQEFENNFNEKIEAVYVFPLPQMAAVDDMTMRVGARTVRGKILKREEARDVYETAKTRGQVASLLDQERPNIFTQSVANIMPGEKVTLEISYVETLKYENGSYEFVFPTVVGPRYNPGAPVGQQAGGFSPDTTRVPDASKITPMPAKTRAGHDISIEVNLDAGVTVQNIISKSHQIETTNMSANRAVVKLKSENEIPNKDFVLRYDVAGQKIADAVLTHRDERGGYFTLILQPPDEPRQEDITPKEIVFVLDTSGSMMGFPIEKAKESMKLALDAMNSRDTFNLITFAGDTHVLFEKPVRATRENLQKAATFLESRQGSGGTEMMKAIKAALDPSDAQDHVRIVCFMTDGYVGNDLEIIGEIQKHPNARVFSFGIGSSVNRFLLDKMAETGRGEVEYVALDDDGSAAAKRFHERVRSPLLTDIEIDWNGLPVADVYPRRILDLFSAKPLIVHGRFTRAANGTIRLKGKAAGREIVREIAVSFPENEAAHDTLATLWARTRVDDLMAQDYQGIQQGNTKPEIKETIVNLGLEYRLLTQFTSFVAVEEMVVTDGGQPRRVDVPVEMPEGVSREGVFGDTIVTQKGIANLPVNGRGNMQALMMQSVVEVSAESVTVDTKDKVRVKERRRGIGSGSGSSIGAGSGNGAGSSAARNTVPTVISSGVVNVNAVNLPQPAYPPAAKAANASGSVNVQVSIDENGKVIAAAAVSGHPLLRAAAVEAARRAIFKPTMLSGQAVKTTGIIVYNFTDSGVSVTAENIKPTFSSEEQKRFDLQQKLHPTIFALVERLKDAKAQVATEEAKFVTDGKARLKVYFVDKTPEAIEELRKNGFEVELDPTTAKFVIGRIATEKIAALAELKNISFIAPQNK